MLKILFCELCRIIAEPTSSESCSKETAMSNLSLHVKITTPITLYVPNFYFISKNGNFLFFTCSSSLNFKRKHMVLGKNNNQEKPDDL